MYARLPDGKTSLFQWDTKQYLEVSEDVTRVDYCFRIEPEVVYGVFAKNGRCYIPNLLIQKAGIIDALIMSTAIGTTTDRRLEIPVEERPIPPGYVATKDGAIISYTDLEDILGELKFLSTNGGTMAGDINMDGRKITGLVDPVADGDAARKRYVDTEISTAAGNAETNAKNASLPRAGGAMTGNISMGGNTVQGLKAPAAGTDAATKDYVDGKRATFTATLGTAWTGSGPYTQTVAVAGILATDMPHIVPVYSSDNATAIAQKEAWSCVSKAEAAASGIKFTCFEDKPGAAVPLQIGVVR
jgi:hypothetical protein|nr:MAG TPA_asm: hyaluronase tail fiber protein [Caudoviricetes sp.]